MVAVGTSRTVHVFTPDWVRLHFLRAAVALQYHHWGADLNAAYVLHGRQGWVQCVLKDVSGKQLERGLKAVSKQTS